MPVNLEKILSSIDAGLDSAAKLIHQSKKYISSSTPRQISLPHYEDGLTKTMTHKQLEASWDPTSLTYTKQLERIPPTPYQSHPSLSPPHQNHPPAVLCRTIPLETDRLRFASTNSSNSIPIRTSKSKSISNSSSSPTNPYPTSGTNNTYSNKPKLTGRLNGHSMVRLRQACKNSDLDGDGQLTKHEFQHVLGNMGVKITENEANQLCTQYNRTLETPSIDYNHFVRSLTNAPIRTHNSIARDAATHIYKKTGMEVQHFVSSLRKIDTNHTGSIARIELEQSLKDHGVHLDRADLTQMLSHSSTTGDSKSEDSIDYIHLANTLHQAEEHLAMESENAFKKSEHWWRRTETDTPTTRPLRKPSPKTASPKTASPKTASPKTASNISKTSTTTSLSTSTESTESSTESSNVTEATLSPAQLDHLNSSSPVVYDGTHDKKMRGLDGTMHRQRASPLFQRSDVLRPHDIRKSTVGKKQISATGHASRSNKKEYVIHGRIVEKVAEHQHRLGTLLRGFAGSQGEVTPKMLRQSLSIIGVPMGNDDVKRLLASIDPNNVHRQSADTLVAALDRNSLAVVTNPDVTRHHSGRGSGKWKGMTPDTLPAGISVIEHDRIKGGSQSTCSQLHSSPTAKAMEAKVRQMVEDSIVAKMSATLNMNEIGSSRPSADFPSSNRKRRNVDLTNGTRMNGSIRVGLELGHVLQADGGIDVTHERVNTPSKIHTGKAEPSWKHDAHQNESGHRVAANLTWSEQKQDYSSIQILHSGKKQKASIRKHKKQSKKQGAGLNVQRIANKHRQKKRLEPPFTKGQHHGDQVASVIQHHIIKQHNKSSMNFQNKQLGRKGSPKVGNRQTISTNGTTSTVSSSPIRIVHLKSPPPPSPVYKH